MKELQLTLSLVQDLERRLVLLGMKRTGLGKGRWNGFGGKVDEGETVPEAAMRELNEEAGIVAIDYGQVGIVEFIYRNTGELSEGLNRKNLGESFTMHIFRVLRWKGKPKTTREMIPKWFNVDAIPYKNMWPDDKYWLPLALIGTNFNMKCEMEDKDTILSHEIGVV